MVNPCNLGDTMKKKFTFPKDKYKVGDLVEYPMSKAVEEGTQEKTLCIVIEIRKGYYRIQCTKTQRYHNTTGQWIALPTYYPTPMGQPESPHTVIKSL
jgi:hypothetical protein